MNTILVATSRLVYICWRNLLTFVSSAMFVYR